MTGDEDLLWVVDDRPSRRFPVYTRGNVGEVYPNVITPLCGSIVKAPIAEGQARVVTAMGAMVPRDLAEPDRAVITGCFGGYLYANLSMARLMGARAPGMRPEDIDVQMFGTSDAPPYRPQKGDRDLGATARLARFMIRILRGPSFDWLRDERRTVLAWAASRPRPAQASVPQLLATVDQGATMLSDHMRSLLLASSYGGIASAVVEQLAAHADPGARARTAAGVGDVESAGPAVALWRLAQLDDDAAFAAAFDDFLTRYGARGPDEYELASDTWGTRPAIALAAVERLRQTGDTDPSGVQVRVAGERLDALAEVEAAVVRPARPLLRRALRTAAEGAAGRERAKGTLIEGLYPVRLALFELARRAQDGGGPAERRNCFLVTREELPAFVAGPAAFADVIAERAERRDLLQDRIPPFVFEGSMPDPSSWARRDTAPARSDQRHLEGIPVSPGVATGTVRVVRDPAHPGALEPGNVLVAPITDPAWTPLFLVASAVVVEVGANMSHAAIVARELGIPAVVSVPRATEILRDGTRVEVDGTRGTVTIV